MIRLTNNVFANIWYWGWATLFFPPLILVFLRSLSYISSRRFAQTWSPVKRRTISSYTKHNCRRWISILKTCDRRYAHVSDVLPFLDARVGRHLLRSRLSPPAHQWGRRKWRRHPWHDLPKSILDGDATLKT